MRAAIKAADLFCGAGGTSAGLLDACLELNRELKLVAVNHWEVAIQTHTRNHPMAQHYCANLDQVNPLKVAPSRRLDILVASPECTHHSIARGGRPINEQSRASAWVVMKWIQELLIDNILIENVREFADWGPLDSRGRPMKSRRGAIFMQYLNCLKSFGYNVDYQIINCANYGDATTRERLFIMARRGRKPITWPEPTHSPSGGATLFGGKQKWRAAREIIDWGLKGESIYSRKRPLKATTLARIYAGIEKFCGPEIAQAFLRDVESEFPTTLVKEFLVVLRKNGGARDIERPLPAITAGGKHVGLCQFVLQQQSGGAPRTTDQPLPTIATRGAVALAECIVPQFSAHAPRSVDEPLGTITTTSRGVGLAQFILGHPRQKDGVNRTPIDSVDKPLRTITATSSDFAMAEAFVLNIDHHGGNGNQVRSVDDPLATQTTKARACLVEPSIVKYNGTGRANSVEEPLDTITARDRFALVEPRVTPDYQVEVLFRMLQPHELAAAHSVEHFEWPEDATKSDVVKMIGNMVPRRTAKALCKEMLS